MDTMEAAYRMPVFTDITMLDTKASNGKCPPEWRQIYQAYWPGTTESCQQDGELKTLKDAVKSTITTNPCEVSGPGFEPEYQQVLPEAIICAKMLTRADAVKYGSLDCEESEYCN